MIHFQIQQYPQNKQKDFAFSQIGIPFHQPANLKDRYYKTSCFADSRYGLSMHFVTFFKKVGGACRAPPVDDANIERHTSPRAVWSERFHCAFFLVSSFEEAEAVSKRLAVFGTTSTRQRHVQPPHGAGLRPPAAPQDLRQEERRRRGRQPAFLPAQDAGQVSWLQGGAGRRLGVTTTRPPTDKVAVRRVFLRRGGVGCRF